MKHVYVAGPYRGPNRWVVHQNIQLAEALGMQVACLGAVPVIPHTMYSAFDGTITNEFWLEATLELLRRCDALLLVPGWERSVGAKGEKIEA